MDWQAILTTILANGLITTAIVGVVAFLIKRKIETSFEKQMEQFKANIQLLVFEQQTKFSRVFPKTLEVIETFHQKYLHFEELTSQYSDNLFGHVLFIEKTGEMLDDSEDEVSSAMNDFGYYLRNNRMYLPEPSVVELEDICRKADALYELLRAARYFSNTQPEFYVRIVRQAEKWNGISMKVIDPTRNPLSTFPAYTKEINRELNKLLLRVEEHHKSLVAIVKEVDK